jgi:hypothetical protein
MLNMAESPITNAWDDPDQATFCGRLAGLAEQGAFTE